jgi:protein O-mannosyl-transferase
MKGKRKKNTAAPRVSPSKGPAINVIQQAPSLPAPIIFLLLLTVTVVSYIPALQGGFLWDDDRHITKPELQSVHGLWRIWSDIGATQQYYPLLHSAFWLEHRLWGDTVLGYHLVNIALHVTLAFLVMLTMRYLLLRGALLAGFIFAIHPACVEAVAWISEQKSTLSGVFYVAAALLYLHFDRSRRRSLYAWATLLFILALLSKTVAATLPAVLLVIFWWQRGRLSLYRDVLPLSPWIALGGAAGLFTAWIERTIIGAQGSGFALTSTQRVLLAGRVIWFYFGKLVWPANLIFTYPRWVIDPSVWWQYLFPAGVVGVGIFLLALARRQRGPLAGFLIFTGTLFPVLGFLNVFPFRYSYVADHFQYLASLGIIVPVSSALAVLSHRFLRTRTNEIALMAVLVCFLGTLSWRQSRSYVDATTLYRDTLAKNPTSWMAHNNLGIIASKSPGGMSDAISEYETALRLYPEQAEGHINLGNALSKLPSRLSDATREYETAIKIRPQAVEAHYNLGLAWARLPGHLSDAVAEYQATLKLDPKLADAHNSLGLALAQMPGRLAEAVAEYQTALQLKPESLEAHVNLGNALSQTPGRLSDAVAEYQAAVSMNPDSAEAHYDLGTVLASLDRQSDAIAEYEAAIRIRPDYAEAHNNLGRAFASMPGKLADAISEYETALRSKPAFAEAYFNLGSALSQMPGRLPQAIAAFEASLKVRPDLEPARRAIEILQARQRQ